MKDWINKLLAKIEAFLDDGKKCENCAHYGKPTIEYPCNLCMGDSMWEKRMTNADRIRAMSDEELAWELFNWRFDAYGKATGNESVLPDTQKTIVEWLKQFAEVDT